MPAIAGGVLSVKRDTVGGRTGLREIRTRLDTSPHTQERNIVNLLQVGSNLRNPVGELRLVVPHLQECKDNTVDVGTTPQHARLADILAHRQHCEAAENVFHPRARHQRQLRANIRVRVSTEDDRGTQRTIFFVVVQPELSEAACFLRATGTSHI